MRTSVWKGMEIMEGLRGHMSGLGIPTYVVDSPHGGGKIPMMPNYLISSSDDAVVLRNYEGMLVRYQAEDRPDDDPADRDARRQRPAPGHQDGADPREQRAHGPPPRAERRRPTDDAAEAHGRRRRQRLQRRPTDTKPTATRRRRASRSTCWPRAAGRNVGTHGSRARRIRTRRHG